MQHVRVNPVRSSVGRYGTRHHRAQRAEEAPKRARKSNRPVRHMNEIVAVDELLFDEQGNACDCAFWIKSPVLRALGSENRYFGRRSSEIYGEHDPELFFATLLMCADRGTVQFEQYFEPTRMHLLVSAVHLGGRA